MDEFYDIANYEIIGICANGKKISLYCTNDKDVAENCFKSYANGFFQGVYGKYLEKFVAFELYDYDKNVILNVFDKNEQ